MKKINIYVLSILLLLFTNPFTSNANEVHLASVVIDNDNAMPCSDVIEYRYRVNNGVYEYRRWNKTKGQWIDANWIPVS